MNELAEKNIIMCCTLDSTLLLKNNENKKFKNRKKNQKC